MQDKSDRIEDEELDGFLKDLMDLVEDVRTIYFFTCKTKTDKLVLLPF